MYLLILGKQCFLLPHHKFITQCLALRDEVSLLPSNVDLKWRKRAQMLVMWLWARPLRMDSNHRLTGSFRLGTLLVFWSVIWAKSQAGACPVFWWSWSWLASGRCCYQVTPFTFPSRLHYFLEKMLALGTIYIHFRVTSKPWIIWLQGRLGPSYLSDIGLDSFAVVEGER